MGTSLRYKMLEFAEQEAQLKVNLVQPQNEEEMVFSEEKGVEAAIDISL